MMDKKNCYKTAAFNFMFCLQLVLRFQLNSLNINFVDCKLPYME